MSGNEDRKMSLERFSGLIFDPRLQAAARSAASESRCQRLFKRRRDPLSCGPYGFLWHMNDCDVEAGVVWLAEYVV